MKTKIIYLLTVLFVITFSVHAQTSPSPKKILVVYFSHSGNTRAVANVICKMTDAEIFEIKTVKPYPEDYQTVVDIAGKELKTDYRPALKFSVKDIRQYDIIFIGYPNWWNTYPQAVKVFLSKHDLSGKIVIPFCTHGGGGFGRSGEDLKIMCPTSTIRQGIAISGSLSRRADDDIEAWLKKLKIIK